MLEFDWVSAYCFLAIIQIQYPRYLLHSITILYNKSETVVLITALIASRIPVELLVTRIDLFSVARLLIATINGLWWHSILFACTWYGLSWQYFTPSKSLWIKDSIVDHCLCKDVHQNWITYSIRIKSRRYSNCCTIENPELPLFIL